MTCNFGCITYFFQKRAQIFIWEEIMANGEKGSDRRETKAGMLGKDYESSARVEREDKTENKPETTPKIGKHKAEGEHGDKPLH